MTLRVDILVLLQTDSGVISLKLILDSQDTE